MQPQDVGIVVIGRNEGDRLRRSLRSVLKQASPKHIVYVDSGSTDMSVAVARECNVHVVELTPDRPFSAARGRNEGAEHLLRMMPSLKYIQFVDGDCELQEGWLIRARDEMEQQGDVAAACGTLHERKPDRSIYNRMCEMEWNGKCGEIEACGGIAVMRVTALADVGMFRAEMTAGEEPELCARLRQAGWKVVRLDAHMATHDADMTRFTQWWRRRIRSGHAWAERDWLHGHDIDPASRRQVASICFWGALLPLLILALAWPTQGWILLLAAAYPIQWFRIYRGRLRAGHGARDAAVEALFTLVGKFAEAFGLVRFVLTAVVRRRPSMDARENDGGRGTTGPVEERGSGRAGRAESARAVLNR